MKQPSLHCQECWRSSESIFHCLTGSSAVKLNAAKVPHLYRKGQTIFFEGNPVFAVYCISSGKVKLYKLGVQGEPQVIRVLGQGEVMGYRPLLANELYAATAEATENTVVCSIPKDKFFELLRDSPELGLRFLEKLSKELRASEDQMLSLIEDSVPKRTARFLLSLAGSRQKASKAPVRIQTSLSHQEMAQVIGTTPETFSRTLHSFARREILSLKNSEISIADFPRLQRIANNQSESVDRRQEES